MAIRETRKSRRMRAVEERFGKPIREVLIEQTERTDNDGELAERFGIHHSTLSQWRLKLNVRIGRRAEAA